MAEIRAGDAGRSASPAPAAPRAMDAAAAAVKPVFMTAARGGRPDDLKVIKGIGPKLEEMLHGMGVFHFDQIAAWTPAEVAWVDDNLEGFKGRVTRDEWVAQARILAAGGSV
jgi:predicted flap endonuclease-1-like 5' DNA nuclease